MGEKKTILFVDDDPRTLHAVSLILRHGLGHSGQHREYDGYEVLEANDGAEALRICAAHHGQIHLFLVDYHMPPMNGPHFVVQARLLRPHAVLLYYTGYELIDLPERWVQKGEPIENLFEAIERALGSAVD